MLKHSIFIFLLISNFILGQSLDLQIITSKSIYKFGEYIDIKINIKNISNDDISFQMPRISSGTVKLHLLSPLGEEYQDFGLHMDDNSKITLKAGEEHQLQITLNNRFGDKIVPWLRTGPIKPGKNQLFAEMELENKKITSKTVTFEVLEMNKEEEVKFNEMKKVLLMPRMDEPTNKSVVEKLEQMFLDSDEGFRQLALELLSIFLRDDLKQTEKSLEIQKKIIREYPSSFSTIILLSTKDFKEQRKKIVKELIPKMKNEFYKEYYQKILNKAD
jgi:hypothetical protein